MSSKDMLALTGVLVNDTCIDDMTLVSCMQSCDDGYIYIAEDAAASLKSVVHEYLPHRLAERQSGRVIVTGDQEFFDEGLRRFSDAARRLTTFSHPAVAAVEGLWSRNGTFYVQTTWHEGQSLWQRLALSREPVTPETLDQWLITCADVLQALREQGIEHASLIPHRMFLTEATGQLMVPVLNSGPRTEDDHAGESRSPGISPAGSAQERSPGGLADQLQGGALRRRCANRLAAPA